MGLPGHHRTSSHKRRRAAHFALKKSQPGVCPRCKKPVLSHRACAFCGFYNGREVLKIKLPKALQKTAAKKEPEDAKEAVAEAPKKK
ncbi:MAG: 50S ribosomal protein L32 [bacterium]